MSSIKLVEKIQKKWSIQTEELGGYFIRFKDGNIHNIHISNMEFIHPYDAFMHPDYKVDWDCSLTKKEIIFVKDNMEKFALLYKIVHLKKDYFDENVIKELDDDGLWFIYYNQHNEDLDYDIPAVDMHFEEGEGKQVFKVYCYRDEKGHTTTKKYMCKVIELEYDEE